MAYIGKQPVVGNFQVCDAISVVNGQAAYTMQVSSTNVEPENANHMLVSLNGVLQKPGSSFTISGATITFASNLATGDVIDFIILLGDVLNTGTPSDNAVVTASIAANAVTGAKLNTDVISAQTALTSAPASTDELLISDAGVLKRIDVSLVGGDNTPAFRAFLNSNKTMSDATTTKVDTFGTEDFDTDNNFASNRFTPTTAGKYFVFLQLAFTNTTDADVMYYAESYIYKNGSQLVKNTLDPKNSNPTNQALLYNATVVDMNGSSDYLEAYANSGVASGAPLVGNGTNQSYFGAYKLIGV